MVEVTLVELKLLTCQNLNNGYKCITKHTHKGKRYLNIIFEYNIYVLATFKVLSLLNIIYIDIQNSNLIKYKITI